MQIKKNQDILPLDLVFSYKPLTHQAELNSLRASIRLD